MSLLTEVVDYGYVRKLYPDMRKLLKFIQLASQVMSFVILLISSFLLLVLVITGIYLLKKKYKWAVKENLCEEGTWKGAIPGFRVGGMG